MNYKALAIIWCIAFFVLFAAIVLHSYQESLAAVVLHSYQESIEQHELELNASWVEGMIYGWDLHLQEIIGLLERDGIANLELNETIGITAYSPQGCIDAVQQAQGGR